MRSIRYALILLSALSCACLPSVVPPSGQAGGETGTADASKDAEVDPKDAGSDAAPKNDASTTDAGPDDPKDMEPTEEACDNNSDCKIYEFCTPRGCLVPSVGAPNELLENNTVDFGNTLAHDEGIAGIGTLFIGVPSERAVYTAKTGPSGSITTPVKLLVGAPTQGFASSMYGVAIDAHNGYAIVGSPGENPTDLNNIGRVAGAVRIYKPAGDPWAPAHVWDNDRNIAFDPGRAFGNLASSDLKPSAEDGFATSVTIDWPWFAAGAPKYNPNGVDIPPGRVVLWRGPREEESGNPELVYGLSAQDWYSNAELPKAGGGFGTAVLIRREHLFVGAPGMRAKDGTVCGGVRIYQLSDDGGPIEIDESPLMAPGCDGESSNPDVSLSRFGSSLAYQPDPIENNEKATLFVGAPGYPEGNGPGAVIAIPFDTSGLKLKPESMGISSIYPDRVSDDLRGFGEQIAPGAYGFVFVSARGESADQQGDFDDGVVFSFVDGGGPRWTQIPQVWTPELETPTGGNPRIGEAMVGYDGTVYVSAPGALRTGRPPRGTVFAMEASRIDIADSN